MVKKIIILLLAFSSQLIIWGQNSKLDTLYNRFFIMNGDTIRYHSEYDWNFSDVDWLMNERTHLYALVDTNLNVLTDFKYRRVTPFYSDFSTAAAKREKWGLVNKKGDEVSKFEYTLEPIPFVDTTLNKEFFIFEKDSKKGVVDATGNIIISFKWNDIFYCNYALIELRRGKKGYLYFMNTGENIPLRNKGIVLRFNKYGKSVLQDLKSGKYGIIDTSGTIIHPCILGNLKEAEKILK